AGLGNVGLGILGLPEGVFCLLDRLHDRAVARFVLVDADTEIDLVGVGVILVGRRQTQDRIRRASLDRLKHCRVHWLRGVWMCPFGAGGIIQESARAPSGISGFGDWRQQALCLAVIE